MAHKSNLQTRGGVVHLAGSTKPDAAGNVWHTAVCGMEFSELAVRFTREPTNCYVCVDNDRNEVKR